MKNILINRKKIILSADDFGISAKANSRILELASLGKIDRVSAMMGSHRSFTQEEIVSLMHYGIKIDIHLDLPDFNVNRKHTGIFSRIFLLTYLHLTGKINKKKTAASWKKQIELFKECFGKYPDGINSHEYLHFFSPYFQIAHNLQNKYNIPFIRLGKRDVLHFKDSRHFILRLMRYLISKKCALQNIISSDHMVSLDWIGDIEDFAKNLPQGSTEIVCHPEKDQEYQSILAWF